MQLITQIRLVPAGPVAEMDGARCARARNRISDYQFRSVAILVCAAGLQHTNVTKNCPYCPYFMPFHFQSQSLEGLEHTVGQLIIVSPSLGESDNK